MKYPCRLELNRVGSWKLLTIFDGENAVAAWNIRAAAELLARMINDPASGRTSTVSLRITTDDPDPLLLYRWTGKDNGRWEELPPR